MHSELTRRDVPALDDDTEALLRRIAFDVGKQLVEQIEHAHPELVQAARSWDSTRLSLRNAVHNSFMEAVKAAKIGEIEQMLARHDKHRRTMRKLRKASSVEEIREVMRDADKR